MSERVPLYAVAPPAAERMAARDDVLELDIGDGLRFSHNMGEDTRSAVFDAALTVLALLEELREGGLLDASYEPRLETARITEYARLEDRLKLHLLDDVDKYTIEGPPVPCAELMHLCRGRCCTLHFPLSHQDLEEHVIRWNYLKPYIIRQRDSDRYCVHNDPTTHFCTAYEHRPAVCRTYDCRKDKRIWLDYEQRIPVSDPALEPKDAPVPQLVFVD